VAGRSARLHDSFSLQPMNVEFIHLHLPSGCGAVGYCCSGGQVTEPCLTNMDLQNGDNEQRQKERKKETG
jgi:hypothetical protein